MNIAESFANYLASTLDLTLGTDLFIGNAPSSNKAVDSVWWLSASGGDKENTLPTGGSMKSYRLDISYRNRDYKAVYNALHSLEEQLNCADCVQLNGFEVIRIEATNFPIDNDLDNEDRKIGLLQANVRVYKDC